MLRSYVSGLWRIPVIVAFIGVFALTMAAGCKKKPAPKAEDAPGETAPPVLAASHITVGALTSCALMNNGAVRCWGSNFDGQLGTGGEPFESYVPMEVPELEGVEKLWASSSYCWSGSYANYDADTVCARLKDQAVRCWGKNSKLYGDGQDDNQNKPYLVAPMKGVLDIGSHCGTACAVMSDKAVKCWGSGSFGQIGDGKDEEREEPTAVLNMASGKEVGCGQNHCCALREDGTVWCWGYNSSGTLGDGTSKSTNQPVQVKDLAGATQLAVANNTSCALTKEGVAMCWGEGFKNSAVAVSGADGNVTQIAAQGFMCAVKKDGSVVCWGSNRFGQLGDGTTTDRKKEAKPVKDLTGATQVAVGVYHACALVEGGEVKCWGRNNRGQLGDGTLEDRPTPVTVANLRAETLTPLPEDKIPTALPTDGKGQTLPDALPKGCVADPKVQLTYEGKEVGLPVRVALATGWEPSTRTVVLANFDYDPKTFYGMTRGAQVMMRFFIYARKPKEGGKEGEWEKEPLDAKEYIHDHKSTRLLTEPTILDNRKQHWVSEGGTRKVTITHVDDNWLCGEMDLSSPKVSVKGKFVAAIPKKD